MMSRVAAFASSLLCMTAQADPIACIKAGVEHVFVDTGEYVLTETLSIPSNVTIYCGPNVTFIAAPGAFKGVNDSLIELKGTQNAIHNCSFKMLRETYTLENGYPRSEYRHCLHLVGASNVKLFNVTTEDCGGDGLAIDPKVNGQFSEDRVPSQNIETNRLTTTRSYRTGVSVTSCINCKLSDCLFADTKGTSTNSGLLVEPSHGGDRAAGIVVERSVARNNAGSAFRVNLNRQNQNSQAVSITFTDCKGEMVPRGHELMQVDEFNWNLNAVKPKGFIRWDRSSWENP